MIDMDMPFAEFAERHLKHGEGSKSACINWLGILHRCCIEEIERHGGPKSSFVKHYLNHGDAGAVQLGALTVVIAASTGTPAPTVRRNLHKLVADGKALMLPTRGGITRWWPKGLASELNA